MARSKAKRRSKKKSSESSTKAASQDATPSQPAQDSPVVENTDTSSESKEKNVETTNEATEEKTKSTSENQDSPAGNEADSAEAEEDNELVQKDAQELLQLLETYQEKIQVVEDQLKGGIEKVIDETDKDGIDTKKGISLLEVKYQLLLSYCVRICFYLLLKLTGKKVGNHKLVDQQAHLRVVLDKLKPIDKKIKYQVSQLLRAAAMDAETEKEDGANPLSFRPNPGKLRKDSKNTEASSEVYVPPQVTPAEFVDKKDKKRAKRQRKMLQKASNNSVVKAMKDMLSEAPQEIDTGGGGDVVNKMETDREKFEEEHFVRLGDTKKDRAQRKKATKDMNSLKSLTDFDDFADIIKLTDKDNNQDARGREDLAALRKEKATRALETSGGKKRKMGDDQEAAPAKKRNRGGNKKKKKGKKR